MKVRLLHHDREFDPQAELPWHAEILAKDLALPVLFEAMAQGDGCIAEVARKVVLTSLANDEAAIAYRQQILRDCLEHPEAVLELYAFAGAAEAHAKKQYLGLLDRYPEWVLSSSIRHMNELLEMIRGLKQLAMRHEALFAAPGWRAFFTRLRIEVDDDYLATVSSHLRSLTFQDGILLSAALGQGHKGLDYRLHRPPLVAEPSWLARLGAWLLGLILSPKPPRTVSPSIRETRGASVCLPVSATEASARLPSPWRNRRIMFGHSSPPSKTNWPSMSVACIFTSVWST